MNIRSLLALAMTTMLTLACEVPDPGANGTLPDTYQAPAIEQVLQDVSYGPDAAHKMDIYYPPTQTRALIVWVHGGGWHSQDKSYVSELALRQASAARGYVVASVDFRLVPVGGGANTFPTPLLDVKRAIRWLKANGASLNIDTSEIIAWGFSTGGYLAAMVGTTADVAALEPTNLPADLAAQDSSVDGVVNLGGPISMSTYLPEPVSGVTTEWFMGCTSGLGDNRCTPAQVHMANVETYYDALDPPMYVAYGTQDPNHTRYASHISAITVPYYRWYNEDYIWYDIVEGFGHGPDALPDLRHGVNKSWLEIGLDQIAAGAKVPQTPVCCQF